MRCAYQPHLNAGVRRKTDLSLAMGQENAEGQVFSPSGLVDYQSGAIVSKTLLKKGKGSVTIFAFDQDQALSEHTVPHDALIQLLEGEAVVTVSGVIHRLKQDDMIVLPANEPHAVRATKRFKMVLTMIGS